MNEKSRAPIRVFLIDDHPFVREGVRSYLSGQRSIEVVGEASDDKEALRKVKALLPDVIVLDVSLPSMDGWDLAPLLRKIAPKAKLVAFSVHASEVYVVKMAQAGVQGYVMKDTPTAQLLDAIVHVSRGGLHFPARMGDAIRQGLSSLE